MIDETFFYQVLLGLLLKDKTYTHLIEKYYNILNNISQYNETDSNKILSFHYYLKYAKFNIPNELSLCITDYCQLKCKHCYFGKYKRYNELNTEQIKYINDKFLALRSYFEVRGFTQTNNTYCYGVLGGEPLLNKELPKILIFLSSHNNNIKLDSNGLLYNQEIVDIMDSTKKSTYQISIDGNEYWHDYIRGDGTYKQSISTIKKIKQKSKNINIITAFNAHSKNYKSIKEMVNELVDNGVDGITFNRYIPTNTELNVLSQKEFLEYKNIILELEQKYKNKIHISTKHLNFDKSCVSSLLRQVCYTNGDRFACNRYQIKTGNWFSDDVDLLAKKSLYYHMKTQQLPIECFNCDNKDNCLGGMRCMNFMHTKNMLEKDIHCIK